MKAEKTDFLGFINKFKSLYIVEALLIFVGALLRLKLYLLNPSFFIDECALGFNIIYKTYSELFTPLYINQCAPPLFLVVCKSILDLSHQVGNLYTQDLVLRAFPLFCSIISLPLFAILMNKITSNKILVWVCVAMLSFNTCAINYSIQFKQYSTELMVALILLLVFQYFDINKLSKKILTLYSLIICASIWFSNTAFIILATGFMYFILRCFSSSFRNDIKSNLPKLCIIIITFLINISAYYFYFKGICTPYLYNFMHFYWVNIDLSFFSFDNFSTLFHKKLQEFINIPFLSQTLLIVFFLINVIILLFKKQDLSFKTKFLIIVPVLTSIILSFLNIYPFERRLILYLLPLYIILYSQIISFIKPNKAFKALTILLLGLFSIYKLIIPIESIYYQNFKQPIRNTAEFIMQNKIPTNKIIFAVNEIPYYMQSYLQENTVLLYDIYWEGFKKSKVPEALKKVSADDYYIFSPISKEYQKKLIKYLNDDKHIKILDTYSNNGSIYIIHIKKISNY